MATLQSQAISLTDKHMRTPGRGLCASPAALTFVKTPATGASSPILDAGEVPECRPGKQPSTKEFQLQRVC